MFVYSEWFDLVPVQCAASELVIVWMLRGMIVIIILCCQC